MLIQKDFSSSAPPEIGAFEVQKDAVQKVVKNRGSNDQIIRFYERLAKEEETLGFDRRRLKNKADRIEGCNRFWEVDVYEAQRVKDFIRTTRCKDKFCNNCKKVLQATRMAKYIPAIELIEEKAHCYHMVLTCPNVKGQDLKKTLDLMFKSFQRLIRFLNGTKSIRGVDFRSWHYLGAIRSFEVTYKGDEYHPHLHVLLALGNRLELKKCVRNAFSRDWIKGRKLRLFSKEEILIQKMWFLLMNGEEVTLKGIEALDKGYSCMIDEFKPGEYAEIFKYMVKSENGRMEYHNFKTLYKTLYHRRQLQGYGCFRGIQEDDELYEEVVRAYSELIRHLGERERPRRRTETPEVISKDDYTLITRSKLRTFLLKALESED